MVRTLLWWNRGDGAAAFFWHETAARARSILIEECGAACRIELRPGAGLRMASLLSPDLAFMEHGGDPARLGEAVLRLAGDACPWRVAAADAIDAPELFAAAMAALRPDVTSLGEAAAQAFAGSGQAALRWPSVPGCAFHASDAARPILEGWLRAFDERARRRRETGGCYRIDELATAGLHPIDPQAPVALAWTGPGRRATLLLPGHGGGVRSVVLHLMGARLPLDAAHLRLLVDGVEATCRFAEDRIEALTRPLSERPCHRLDILQGSLGGWREGLGIAAVAIEPA